MAITLRPAPPSMRALVTATLLIGVHNMGSAPAAAVDLGWSLESKVMAYCDHLRGLRLRESCVHLAGGPLEVSVGRGRLNSAKMQATA